MTTEATAGSEPTNAPAPAPGTPAAAPAPSPAAAPAAPGIDLPTPAPAPAIEPTGDPALDLALEFFAKHGIDGRHAALKSARETGDFSVVKAILAEKGAEAKGFERYTDLAQRAADSAKANAEALKTKTQEAVYKEAGGKEQWDSIREWAAKNATADESAQVNAALKQGGLVARAMASLLVGMHAKSSGATAPAPAQKQEALPSSAARAASTAAAPMGPREFSTAVAQLTQRFGPHGLEARPEYQQLLAARRAHRG